MRAIRLLFVLSAQQKKVRKNGKSKRTRRIPRRIPKHLPRTSGEGRQVSGAIQDDHEARAPVDSDETTRGYDQMTYKPEADLNHNQPLDQNHRYACHNREDMSVTRGMNQNGWTDDGRRNMVERETRWLEVGCGHTYRSTDPCCTSCKWR